MKKFLKISLLFVLIFVLTACGSSKIVATKTETDSLSGEEIKATIEIKFDKDDKPTSMTLTQEYEDKETAEQVYGLLSGIMGMAGDEEDLGMEIKHSGKKVTMEIDASSESFEYSEDADIEELKQQLEDEGWDVK